MRLPRNGDARPTDFWHSVSLCYYSHAARAATVSHGRRGPVKSPAPGSENTP